VNPISSWPGLAFQDLGLGNLSSLTSASLLGWSWISQTLDPTTQVRSSAAELLWEAFWESSNLLLYKSTLAKRIIFEDGKTMGVVADSGGVT
jgi:choline dehydrogenase